MPQVDRFSVSLDTELLAAFDRHIAAKGYESRSEAVRDMIRDLLMSSKVPQGDEEVSAFLTVVCDHRAGDVARRLRARLNENSDVTLGALQTQIDAHRDSYVTALKGPADRVQELAGRIQAMRGISHGHVSIIPVKERT